MNDKPIPDEATVDQAPEPNWEPTLTILSGKDAGRCVGVEKTPFKLGRARGSDLIINDEKVSRTHAELRFENGTYTLRDLGSRWGTSIKGERIQDRTIQFGDEFELAGVVLKFDMSLKSSLTPKKTDRTKLILVILIILAIAAAATMFYFKGNVAKNLDRPGADVLSQIMYHYDKGINYYNQLDRGKPEEVKKVIDEMKAVIELDPQGQTRFSRSARRIIDGLEE